MASQIEGRSAGIDLGTSNLCIAILTSAGVVEVIPNAEGERITPSYVAYRKSGDVLVGKSARMQALANPKNTYYSVKRFIGCRPDDVPDEDIARLSYDVVSVDGALRLKCPILDRVFCRGRDIFPGAEKTGIRRIRSYRRGNQKRRNYSAGLLSRLATASDEGRESHCRFASPPDRK